MIFLSIVLSSLIHLNLFQHIKEFLLCKNALFNEQLCNGTRMEFAIKSSLKLTSSLGSSFSAIQNPKLASSKLQPVCIQ
jgi:hypothetical protein